MCFCRRTKRTSVAASATTHQSTTSASRTEGDTRIERNVRSRSGTSAKTTTLTTSMTAARMVAPTQVSLFPRLDPTDPLMGAASRARTGADMPKVPGRQGHAARAHAE